MPSSRGIKKTSPGKVGYAIKGTKEKARNLPELKEGQVLADGVVVVHNALEIFRKSSKIHTAKLNKLMRQFSADALKYTQADGPMLNAVATTIHNKGASVKMVINKMMTDVRGSGLNMGQTASGKKLSDEDYVVKFKDTAIKYGCDGTEFDGMTLQKQKKMILAVKWANKKGLHIPVDQLLQKYKDSKAPRKPKVGSTAPTAPKAPVDWKDKNWNLLATKAKKPDSDHTFSEGVNVINADKDASGACKTLMLLQHVRVQPPPTVTGVLPTHVLKALNIRSNTLRDLGVEYDTIKTQAGDGASLQNVADKVGDELMGKIITFLRTEMGMTPTIRTAQTRVVKNVEVNSTTTNNDVRKSTESDKGKDAMPPLGGTAASNSVSSDCDNTIKAMGTDAAAGLVQLNSDDGVGSKRAAAPLTSSAANTKNARASKSSEGDK